MTHEYKIKDGLFCSIKTLYNEQENTSFLKKYSDHISLICHFSGLNCSLTFADMPISHDIEITFQHNYLNQFASIDGEAFIELLPEYQHHEICCESQMILHQIINCKMQGALKNMFLESKALALLLCFQKCYLPEEQDCSSCKFLTKPVEKEKILKAKEILLHRLNNPPTISELSLQIGINQCYLKKGFKELFGTTVYAFVQEQRMLKAKLLLTTTDFSVSQVADQIGFSSASSFSSAFKKLTGVFPSEMGQN